MCECISFFVRIKIFFGGFQPNPPDGLYKVGKKKKKYRKPNNTRMREIPLLNNINFSFASKKKRPFLLQTFLCFSTATFLTSVNIRGDLQNG